MRDEFGDHQQLHAASAVKSVRSPTFFHGSWHNTLNSSSLCFLISESAFVTMFISS